MIKLKAGKHPFRFYRMKSAKPLSLTMMVPWLQPGEIPEAMLTH